MDWNRHKSSWPNARFSNFVHSTPHHWHVQRVGKGASVLLLHGAGASTHSWAGMFSLLAKTNDVIAIDLPGQGFTRLSTRNRCGLDAMTQDIARLLKTLDVEPDLIIGHSAGSAIALKLVSHLSRAPRIVSINGALENFSGVSGILFPVFAKLLALNPASGHLFSIFSGSESRIRKLLSSTGSQVSQAQISCYQSLVSDPGHVNATLAMMAQWSLDDMPKLLRSLPTEVQFIIGGNDRTVPPNASLRAAKLVAQANTNVIPTLGHLMHEEDPRQVANLISSNTQSAHGPP